MSHNYKGKQLFALILILLFITALNLIYRKYRLRSAGDSRGYSRAVRLCRQI